MRVPSVQVRTSDGRQAVLHPGDIVGRMQSAALRLADVHISEAHALVSLRGADFHLLALRGVLLHRRELVRSVALRAGVVVELAEGIGLEVLAVELPERVTALRLPSGAVSRLERSNYSLRRGPQGIELVPGIERDALVWLWQDGAGRWFRQASDGVSEPLVPGQKMPVGEASVEVFEQTTEGTVPTAASIAGPLQIIARWDVVVLRRTGQPDVSVVGLRARLLSELGIVGKPIHWRSIAELLWSPDVDRARLRLRWDKQLGVLRAQLRDAGIGRELVRSAGRGLVELQLTEGDVFVDET